MMLLSIEVIIKFQPKLVFLHVYSWPIRSNGQSSLAHQEFGIPPNMYLPGKLLLQWPGWFNSQNPSYKKEWQKKDDSLGLKNTSMYSFCSLQQNILQFESLKAS